MLKLQNLAVKQCLKIPEKFIECKNSCLSLSNPQLRIIFQEKDSTVFQYFLYFLPKLPSAFSLRAGSVWENKGKQKKLGQQESVSGIRRMSLFVGKQRAMLGIRIRIRIMVCDVNRVY